MTVAKFAALPDWGRSGMTHPGASHFSFCSRRSLTLHSTGSKIVRFDIPNLTRRFTVHEDVICRSSKVFKIRFQQQRREITASCSTCFDDLDAVTEEITFCDKCGQNFHDACIGRWMMERLRTFQPMTCPTCRGSWTDRSRPNIEHLKIEQKLDGQAVQVYFDWLYSGTVRIDASVPRTDDDFNVALLQCWEVSDAMGDEAFREAVIQEFFDEAEAHFWAKSIDYAFVDGKGSKATRDFIMDVFLTRVPNDWFKTESRKWPKTFVQKLADHCLKKALSGEKIKTYEEIESMYMKSQADEGKEEVMDAVSADDEDVEDLPLSVLSRSIVHGRTTLRQCKEDSRTDRDSDRSDRRSERASLLGDLRSRSSSPNSYSAAGRSGLGKGSAPGASNLQGPSPARARSRRGRPAIQAGIATLHGGPARPRSFGDMPRFRGART